MRRMFLRSVLMILAASPLLAQGEEARPSLLTLEGGVMFWTLVVFAVTMFVLVKFAFKPITAAVEAREEALVRAIASAKATLACASIAADIKIESAPTPPMM